MKPISRIFRTLALAALAWMALPFTGCKEAENTDPVVDLRYDVEDEYVVSHANPEAVTIRVRSLYTPWEVTGSGDASWYTITPSHGEAGETVTVTIQCAENTVLDDREDIFTIKSDYWTAKQFKVLQKGTAYLEADDMTLEKAGDSYTLKVSTNQKWSAAVTEGEDWLTISSGTSGEFDGEIGFSVPTNLMEQREGIITLYDRYDRPTVDVILTQKGVVLDWAKPYEKDPEPDEDEVEWIRFYEAEQEVTVPLMSNAVFTAEKSDPETEDWFEIVQSRYESNSDEAVPHTLTLKLAANTGTVVRTGMVILTTIPEEDGIPPVQKIVTFKQANERVVTILKDNTTISGQARVTDGLPAGRYDFKVQGANGAGLRFTFFYTNKLWTDGNPRELRYWTNRADGSDDGVPIMSTMPWVNNPFNPDACVSFSKAENPGTYAKIDKSLEHTLTLDIQKAKLEDEESLRARIIWMIDGKVIANNNSANDGIMYSNNGNWDMTYDEMNVPDDGYITAFGNFTIIEATHTAPINWGN